MGNALLLLPLIKALSATRRPFVCAFIYMLGVCTGDLMFQGALGASATQLAWGAGVAFGKCAAWFWLLDTFESADLIYWPTLVVGLLVMMLT